MASFFRRLGIDMSFGSKPKQENQEKPPEIPPQSPGHAVALRRRVSIDRPERSVPTRERDHSLPIEAAGVDQELVLRSLLSIDSDRTDSPTDAIEVSSYLEEEIETGLKKPKLDIRECRRFFESNPDFFRATLKRELLSELQSQFPVWSRFSQLVNISNRLKLSQDIFAEHDIKALLLDKLRVIIDAKLRDPVSTIKDIESIYKALKQQSNLDELIQPIVDHLRTKLSEYFSKKFINTRQCENLLSIASTMNLESQDLVENRADFIQTLGKNILSAFDAEPPKIKRSQQLFNFARKLGIDFSEIVLELKDKLGTHQSLLHDVFLKVMVSTGADYVALSQFESLPPEASMEEKLFLALSCNKLESVDVKNYLDQAASIGIQLDYSRMCQFCVENPDNSNVVAILDAILTTSPSTANTEVAIQDRDGHSYQGSLLHLAAQHYSNNKTVSQEMMMTLLRHGAVLTEYKPGTDPINLLLNQAIHFSDKSIEKDDKLYDFFIDLQIVRLSENSVNNTRYEMIQLLTDQIVAESSKKIGDQSFRFFQFQNPFDLTKVIADLSDQNPSFHINIVLDTTGDTGEPRSSHALSLGFEKTDNPDLTRVYLFNTGTKPDEYGVGSSVVSFLLPKSKLNTMSALIDQVRQGMRSTQALVKLSDFYNQLHAINNDELPERPKDRFYPSQSAGNCGFGASAAALCVLYDISPTQSIDKIKGKYPKDSKDSNDTLFHEIRARQSKHVLNQSLEDFSNRVNYCIQLISDRNHRRMNSSTDEDRSASTKLLEEAFHSFRQMLDVIDSEDPMILQQKDLYEELYTLLRDNLPPVRSKSSILTSRNLRREKAELRKEHNEQNASRINIITCAQEILGFSTKEMTRMETQLFHSPSLHDLKEAG